MKIIQAFLLSILPIILAIFVHPTFESDVFQPLVSAQLTFAVTCAVFLLIFFSISGVFISVFENGLPRMILNVIFSLLIVSYLLPVAFSYLNAGIFSMKHNDNVGYISAAFIKSKEACGIPVTKGFVSGSNRLVFESDKTRSIAVKSVDVLCPVTRAPGSLLYKTDKVLAASIVMDSGIN